MADAWGQNLPRRRAAPQPPAPQSPAGQRPGAQQPVAAPLPAQAVHQIVPPWIEKAEPPGVIVVVRRDGATHFFEFGEADRRRKIPLTPDSVFELASLTKVFATTSLALEIEAGRMQLDDHLGKFIPYLREHGGQIKQVTLRQLATHTSSLPRTPQGNPPGGEWNRELILQWLAEWKAPYPPGTKSLYSNVAVGLLGHAIETLEDKPLIDVWQQQFLHRLNMQHTFFEPPAGEENPLVQGYNPAGEPIERGRGNTGWVAGGRLCSSGRDMAEFLTANLGERPDLPKITAAMKLAQKPYFDASPHMTQGLAWQRLHFDGELMIDKNGGLADTSTYLGMLPQRKVGVVIMANRGKCNATLAGRRLLMALIGKKFDGAAEDD